jgi:23S rRNA (uridine2552-2'-O)-methyltransferase
MNRATTIKLIWATPRKYLTGHNQIKRYVMDRSRDYYSKKARREGYPARSVYKLQEIDQRYGLIKAGYTILDLGCCPGSWLKYCAQKAGEKGLVVGVDRAKPADPLPTNTRFVLADINQLPFTELEAISEGFKLVLSDLAPATTGVKLVDEQASLALASSALALAQKLLLSQGNILLKVFQGGEFPRFVTELKPHFKQVRLIRPKAVRKESREIYVLGLGKI